MPKPVVSSKTIQANQRPGGIGRERLEYTHAVTAIPIAVEINKGAMTRIGKDGYRNMDLGS